MPVVKDLKNHLDTYFKDDDVIAYQIWQVDDVLSLEEDYEEGEWNWGGGGEEEIAKKITKEIAEEVLEAVHDHQDAELGISWESLKCALDDILERNK